MGRNARKPSASRPLVQAAALILVLALSAGCGAVYEPQDTDAPPTPAPNTYLPQLILDGETYFLSPVLTVYRKIEESEYLGRIASVVPMTRRPTEDGQANFGEVGDPYAAHETGIVVLWNGDWKAFAK